MIMIVGRPAALVGYGLAHRWDHLSGEDRDHRGPLTATAYTRVLDRQAPGGGASGREW